LPRLEKTEQGIGEEKETVLMDGMKKQRLRHCGEEAREEFTAEDFVGLQAAVSRARRTV
jgi:hypothetical protein